MSSMVAGADFEIAARWIDVYSELTSEQSIAAPDRVGGAYPVRRAGGDDQAFAKSVAAAPVSFAGFLGQI